MKRDTITMALISCPECDREISSEAPSCPHCGMVAARLPEMMKLCPRCGHANETTAGECVNWNEGPFGKPFYCRTDLTEVAAGPGIARMSTRAAPGDLVAGQCRVCGVRVRGRWAAQSLCANCEQVVPALTPQVVHQIDPQGRGSAGNVIAALASLFIPGLGQLVQGRFFSAVFLFFLTGFLWLILLGWIIHIVAALEAAMYQPNKWR